MHIGVLAFLMSVAAFAAQQAAPKTAPAPLGLHAKTFDSPQQAADALVDAAEGFDVRAFEEIFGPNGEDIVLSGEFPQDRQRASDFAAQAHEKKSVSVDPKSASRAFLVVGREDWQFPAPLVRHGGKWSFDAAAGRQELLYRRIRSNELQAIEICHNYVGAQNKYATNAGEYAERIISRPGLKDGLAWQNPDGSWGGPIGAETARVIEEGYSSMAEPYHGYFFKILKGQGPAAPLGEKDFTRKGINSRGFALVASPAEYGVTGVQSFIVSHYGIIYEKDLGPASLNLFTDMDRFNPDHSWKPVVGMGKTERSNPTPAPISKSRAGAH